MYSGQKLFACPICDKKFKFSSTFKIHLGKHRKAENKSKGNLQNINDDLNKEADGHTNTSEHNEKKTTLQAVAKKTLKNGNKPKEEDNSMRIFACQICKQTFSNRSHLMRHKNKHLGVNHQCDVCGHSYTSRWSLKVHLLGHQNVRPWACDQCGARFFQGNHLKRHIKIHTGERDQICEQCGKRFKDKGGLLAHQQTHNDIESITCAICGLHLKHKTSMRAHLKLHKGVKEFTCDVCKRSFAQKKTYTAHKRLHANVDSVRHVGFLLPPKAFCTVCNRAFVNDTGLKKHAKKHELGLLKRNKHTNHNVNRNFSSGSQNGNLQIEVSKDKTKIPDRYSLSAAVGKDGRGRVQLLKEVQLKSCVGDELDGEVLCSETTSKMKGPRKGTSTVHQNRSLFTDAAEVKKRTILLLKVVNKPNVAVTNYLKSPLTLTSQSNMILTDKPMPASTLGDFEKDGVQKNQTQTHSEMTLQSDKNKTKPQACLNNDTASCHLNLKENIDDLHRDTATSLNNNMKTILESNKAGTITTNNYSYKDNEISNQRDGTHVELLKSHSLESTTKFINVITDSSATSVLGKDNNTNNPPAQRYSDCKKRGIGNPIEQHIDLSSNTDDIRTHSIESPNQLKDSDVPSKPIDAHCDTLSMHDHGDVSESVSNPSLCTSAAQTFDSDTSKHEQRSNDTHAGSNCSDINSGLGAESLPNDNSLIQIFDSNYCKAEKLIMCDKNTDFRKKSNDHPGTVQQVYRLLDGEDAGDNESDGNLDESLEEMSNAELCGTLSVDACFLTDNYDSTEHMDVGPDKCLVNKDNELNQQRTLKYLSKGEQYPGTRRHAGISKYMFMEGNKPAICKKSATKQPRIRRRELECTRLQERALPNQLKTQNKIRPKRRSNSKYTCNLSNRSSTTMRTLGIHSKSLRLIEVKQLNKQRSDPKDSSGKYLSQLRRSSLRSNREGHNKSKLRKHAALHKGDINECDKPVSSKRSLNDSKKRNVNNEETSVPKGVTLYNNPRNKLVKQNTCITAQPSNEKDIEKSDEQIDKDSRQAKYFPKRRDALCELCGKEFTKTAHLERHLKQRSCVKPSTCSLCGKGFKTAAILEKHIGRHHNKGFPCNICEKVFVSTYGLRRHKLAHIDGSPYLFVPAVFECQLCDKRYTSKSSLKDHNQQHEGVRFTCDRCGKGYSRRHHLTRHVSVAHLGKRPFICNVDGCNKSFSYADALDCHKRVHSGVKTNQCSECGKCFSQSQGLRTHMKKHRGIKEFKCEVCHQEFSVKMSMLRHVKRHAVEANSGGANGNSGKSRPVKKMAEKSHSCMHGCGRMFTTKRAMLTHLRKHCPFKKSTSV